MDALAGRRVLVGVSGGIAAYKAASLVRLLVGAGAVVDVALTRGATRFVGAATFAGLTGRPVGTEVWDDVASGAHVALGREADAVVVYPATAHTIARLAAGLADDLLTSAVLAATGPVVVAPAMHAEMWTNAATVANVATLVERGMTIIGPDEGTLMRGDHGVGRLVDPEVALDAVVRLAVARADLVGRRVLVTAGGTQEPIDPVRFLGNRSSGRMGFALAEAARRRGAEVVLIAAPTSLATPAGVERIDVVTAVEMRDAVLARADAVDVVLKAAAVADFRPAAPAPAKLKRAEGVPTLTLIPNPDIVAELVARRGAAVRPLLVAFAAETGDLVARAAGKLAAKGVDLVVGNDVSDPRTGFGSPSNAVVVIGADGRRIDVALAPKAAVADAVLDEVARRLGTDVLRASGREG